MLHNATLLWINHYLIANLKLIKVRILYYVFHENKISIPLQFAASVGSVKQALTTSRSVVSVVQVESSHFPARTNGRVPAVP